MTDERRRFRYFGASTPLTPVAQAIMDENIQALEETLGRDWLLNEPFQFSERCTGLAIQLALVERKYRVVDFLLSKRVNLNVAKAPAMVSAVSALDTAIMDRLIAAGADVRARNNVGYDALDQAVAWEAFELIPYLESKGLSIRGHKGKALDSAVFAGNLDFVEYALKKGADPNQNNSTDQGGTGGTPLHSAVLRGNFEMVKLLVRYGANPTRTDVHGQRPYHWAQSDKKKQIAEYLRGIEPKALHDARAKLSLAKRYGAPADLIEFMGGSDRRLKASEGRMVVELWPIEDLYEFRWMGRRYLTLSRVVEDEFACGEIVWCKKRRAVCVIDIEHDELFEMGGWSDFARDPAAAIARIWNGELDERN